MILLLTICKVVQANRENKALLISTGVTKIDGENLVPGKGKAPIKHGVPQGNLQCDSCDPIGTRAIDGLAAAEKADNMRVIVSVRQEEGALGVAPLGVSCTGQTSLVIRYITLSSSSFSLSDPHTTYSGRNIPYTHQTRKKLHASFKWAIRAIAPAALYSR